MYRRILVPLDGSPAAEEAVPHALAQARAFEAELVLLRVIPTRLPTRPSSADSTAAPSPDGGGDEGEVERTARRYLEAVAETMRSRGVSVAYHVRRGHVAETILDEAHAIPADLLVLATHSAGMIPRLLVGGIAVQVVTRTPCPVLLVRAGPVPATPDGRVRSFAADAARHGPLVQRPLGLRTVTVDRIVGSVGRADELRADFLPRRAPAGDARYRRIRAALERGDWTLAY